MSQVGSSLPAPGAVPRPTPPRRSAPHTTPRTTLWEEGHEPGREMVALGVALALTAAGLDLLATGRLGVLFDLGFVALCIGLALAVRPRDFFTIGVLPPLLMLSTFLLLAATRSAAIARPDDGVVQAVVSGLSHHSGALAVGYLGCLAVLFVRSKVLARAAQRGWYVL